MVLLKIYNHKTIIDQASDAEFLAIIKSLRIWNENPKSYFNKDKRPFTSILYKKEKAFPTGFLDIFIQRIKRRKIKYKIEDCRHYPIASHNYSLKNTEYDDLWENQEIAFDAIKKNPVGAISSPTGTGKTKIISLTIDYLKVKTLIIVPSTSVQEQMYEKYCELFGKENVGFDAPKFDAKVTISKINYINKKVQEQLDNPDENNYKKANKASLLYDNEKTNIEDEDIKSRIKRLLSEDEELVKLYDQLKDKTITHQEKVKLKQKIQYKEAMIKVKEKQKETYKKNIEKARKPKLIKLSKKQEYELYGYPISIVCFQSLPSLTYEYLQSVECVIIDECHHASAKSIRYALDKMPNAGYRYAFSATVWRDKKSEDFLLKSAIGTKILYELKGYEAVAKKIIVKPELYYITPPSPDTFLKKVKHWRTIVDKGIVHNRTRNESIVRKALELASEGENVFICIDEVDHMNELEKMFKKKKIEPLLIYGKLNKKDKKERIKKVGLSLEGLISIGTMAVGEGTDMPEITVIILASYGKATIRLLQRIGRGVRKTGRKELTGMKVFDYDDCFNPTLQKHSNMRKNTFKLQYEKEPESIF